MKKALISLAFLLGCYTPHPNMVGERTQPVVEHTNQEPQTDSQEAGQRMVGAARDFAQHPLGNPENPIELSEDDTISGLLSSIPSAETRRREALTIAQIYSTRDLLERTLEQRAYENRQERIRTGQNEFTAQELDGADYRALQIQIGSIIEELAQLYCTDTQRFAAERSARLAEIERKINEYSGYGLSIMVMPVEQQEEFQDAGQMPARPEPAPLPALMGREEREARMRLSDLQRRRALCQSQYDSGRINQVNYDSSSRALDEAIQEIERRLPN
ncbi:hypothetical protein J4219_02060 [Candidatus Woesearchaeota archaeon]|nr:hypothetical protein [Candidatus Woesearchaeota archaeon]